MKAMLSEQHTASIDRDARWVGQSFWSCAVAGLLAGVGVLPWMGYSFLASQDKEHEMERYVWAWLFYASGLPLLVISGVFYVRSLVYAMLVVRRRPVVWWWMVVSVVVLASWGVFAMNYLD
jgi:hypothetical protein